MSCKKCRCSRLSSNSSSDRAKPPLMSSLLYTQGTKKVQDEVEEELQIEDPAPEAAEAAIRQGRISGELSECEDGESQED